MKKLNFIILFAVGISLLTMSFTKSSSTEIKVIAIETNQVKNLKKQTAAEVAFTPLVTVALAENSVAATVVATASLVGRVCRTKIAMDKLEKDALRVEFKNLDN